MDKTQKKKIILWSSLSIPTGIFIGVTLAQLLTDSLDWAFILITVFISGIITPTLLFIFLKEM